MEEEISNNTSDKEYENSMNNSDEDSNEYEEYEISIYNSDEESNECDGDIEEIIKEIDNFQKKNT